MNRLFFSVFVVAAAACSSSSDADKSKAPPPPSFVSGAETPPSGSEGAITLEVVVDGAATVTSEPAGIACHGPATCSATFNPSTKITLTAAAGEGWTLNGFASSSADACTSTSPGSCVIDSITSDTTVTSKTKQIDPRWDPSVGAIDCVNAWGNNGDKLSPCDTTPDDYVVAHKSKRNVALCKSGVLVKNFRSGLGFAPDGTKVKQGDGKTPEGVFYIPRLVPDSSYYKAFLISYPTPADAARGLNEGLITQAQKSQIENAFTACTEPSQSTNLGGEVEIHGNGSSQDWTHGCVAVDDKTIDQLWATLGVHDTIVVLP